MGSQKKIGHQKLIISGSGGHIWVKIDPGRASDKAWWNSETPRWLPPGHILGQNRPSDPLLIDFRCPVFFWHPIVPYTTYIYQKNIHIPCLVGYTSQNMVLRSIVILFFPMHIWPQTSLRPQFLAFDTSFPGPHL